MKINELVEVLQERRNKVLNGRINCIPSPFRRFTSDFVGIEQGKYYQVTANTKIGKTQLTNYLFVYSTLMYAYRNQKQVRVKIYYFNLEESEQNITLRFISYMLYTLSKGKIHLSTKDLKSTNANKPLSQEIIDLLKEEPYKSFFEFYDKCVEFRSERHPTGIHKAIESYVFDHGTVHYKDQIITNRETGQKETVRAFDYYTPNDPDEYFIPIIDHAGNLQTEAGANTLKMAMDLLSGYLVKDRNRYNITPVEVIQQNAEQESSDNFKLKKLKPSLNGYGDSKTIARDADLVLGLYSPYRYEIKEYLDYDITRFRNHIRFMEVIVNREGEQNGICPLYFDGCTNFFDELPLPKDPALNNYYNMVDFYKKTVNLLIKKKKIKIKNLWRKLLRL